MKRNLKKNLNLAKWHSVSQTLATYLSCVAFITFRRCGITHSPKFVG